MKCEWCNNPEHVITLREVFEDGTIGAPRRVCYKHLYPSIDPCPYKAYQYFPDLKRNAKEIKAVNRVWKTGEALREILIKRCAWFKDNKWNKEEANACTNTPNN